MAFIRAPNLQPAPLPPPPPQVQLRPAPAPAPAPRPLGLERSPSGARANQMVVLGSPDAPPPPTTLLTENINDGSRNCLDAVGDWLALAPPQLRSRADVLILRDTRGGAEGTTGHVVIRQGDTIFDPSTGKTYPSFNAFNAEGNYRLAYTVGGGAMHKILSAPPNSPERQAALNAARVPQEVQQLLVADSPAQTGGVSLTTSMTSVTADLQVALAATPPDPVLIDQLMDAAATELAIAEQQLANLPSDLAGGPAADIAEAAGELLALYEQAAAQTGLPAELRASAAQGAREARATLESAEAVVAMSAYVSDPTEASFDAYVREFADAQVANQIADLERSALNLANATPEEIAALGASAAEIEALRAYVGQDPYQALDESLAALASSPHAGNIANQYGLTVPITSEQLLALPADRRMEVARLLESSQSTVVMSPPPPDQPQPVNPTAEHYGPTLTEALGTIAQLEASGLTWEQASQQAGARIAELYQQNPLLGVVDTAALASQVHPGLTATVLPTPGGLTTRFQLGGSQYSGSEAGRAALLSAIAGQSGFAATVQSVRSSATSTLSAATADLRAIQRNLENANPPPTARDLMPTASLAFEALVSRLSQPGEAQGASGQPGPLGEAILHAAGLFDRYAEQDAAQRRTDLVIGVGGAVAGIAATILTGGGAAPLLIGALATTSIAAGGYSMYRSHENYVSAERLSQFGELSGVENPNELLYALEQGLNILGIVFDAGDLARAATVMRGVDAATTTARAADALSSLEALRASPLGLRLAGRLDAGELTQDVLQGLQDLQAGRYTFQQLAEIANRAVTAPETLTASERALNEIVRAERLLTPQALDLFQRYQLTMGISPEDAYRQALAAAGGDATQVSPELAQDFVNWMSRPSTVDAARAIVMSLPSFSAADVAAFRRAAEIPANVPDETVLRVLNSLPSNVRSYFDLATGQVVNRTIEEMAAMMRRGYRCGDVAGGLEAAGFGRRVDDLIASGDVWYNGQHISSSGGHSYVVDSAGKVWDPITNNYGTLTVEQYLGNMSTTPP